MSKRAEYLDGKLTHSEYYGLLVELLGEAYLRDLLPGDRTPEQWRELIEADKNLNNVYLQKWDNMDPLVRLRLHHNADERAEITGSKGWSLSDTVCVLKETARRYAKEAS